MFVICRFLYFLFLCDALFNMHSYWQGLKNKLLLQSVAMAL